MECFKRVLWFLICVFFYIELKKNMVEYNFLIFTASTFFLPNMILSFSLWNLFCHTVFKMF